MIRLIFVRHGNTFEAGQKPVQIGAKTDLPLTDEGRRQAEAMARYLVSEKIELTKIYAGNLKRQRECAQILGGFILEPALTEIDYGAWEGLTAEEISQRWPREYDEWNKSGKWPEGIFALSANDYRRSIEQWLGKVRGTHNSGETILGVTSNGLLRLFHNEKVKTGHFCEWHLFPHHFEIKKWNVCPN